MVRSYRFAIVRLAPEGMRDERVNIGAAVFSEEDIDVRLSRRLDKVRAISAAFDHSDLDSLAQLISEQDSDIRSAGISDPAGRWSALGRIGPIQLAPLGTFVASDGEGYEHRIRSILKAMVEPEPAPVLERMKRSRLMSRLKLSLKSERILAGRGENLDSHRVVSNWPLAEGLVADFVLKNGAMHVIETVDFSRDEVSVRKAVSDIAVSALVLEQARMSYGREETRARLVYDARTSAENAARPSLDAAANQGAQLVNWASEADRTKLLNELTSLARPTELKSDQHRFAGNTEPLI